MSGSFSNARLSATPQAAAQKLQAVQAPVGLHKLGISQGRKDGVLFVPPSYNPSRPTPLVLTLHGAGANGMGESSAYLTPQTFLSSGEP
jgi:poly(3-hydroxybutyrate) depolymerase